MLFEIPEYKQNHEKIKGYPGHGVPDKGHDDIKKTVMPFPVYVLEQEPVSFKEVVHAGMRRGLTSFTI